MSYRIQFGLAQDNMLELIFQVSIFLRFFSKSVSLYARCSYLLFHALSNLIVCKSTFLPQKPNWMHPSTSLRKFFVFISTTFFTLWTLTWICVIDLMSQKNSYHSLVHRYPHHFCLFFLIKIVKTSEKYPFRQLVSNRWGSSSKDKRESVLKSYFHSNQRRFLRVEFCSMSGDAHCHRVRITGSGEAVFISLGWTW